MQAGLLREIIEVHRSVETQSATTGEQQLTWKRIWRGRARVQFSSGTQLLENQETVNVVTRKVTIRTKPYFRGALSTLRVKIGDDMYRILSRDIRITDQATILIVELINT